MNKIIEICDYSHDYDGFAFVEDECECSIHQDEDKYYFCGDCSQRINLDDDSVSGSHGEILITEEDLNLTKRELCLKYCTSKWAKTYDIHNHQDRFVKDTTPVKNVIKEALERK